MKDEPIPRTKLISVKDYLTKPAFIVVVYDDWPETKQAVSRSLRPNEKKLNSFVNGGKGEVTLVDEISFDVKRAGKICGARLYYGSRLVSMRIFPAIRVKWNDAMKIRFILTLTR